MAPTKIILYVIALVAMVLLAMWFISLFGGTKALWGGAKSIVPNITIGAEEVKGEEVMLPKEHEDAVRKLVDTIEQMIGSGKSNCFGNYKLKDYGTGSGLPDLEEEGTVIKLEKDRIEISRGERMAIDLTKELREKMKRFKPCVIAGSRVAKNFYNQFLIERMQDFTLLETPYSQEVSNIVLLEKETIFYDGVEGDFEDGGWLYKDGGGLVCFFPTRDRASIWRSCYWAEEGLDDDCFEEHKNYFERNKCS